MRLILQENIANLGKVGDQVTVRAGYARNFLLPQDKAVRATADSIAIFEQRRVELEKKAADVLAAAQARADKLNGLAVNMTVRASDEGKLFGSIAPRDIAEAATAAGVEVSKHEVSLPEGPIRHIGEYDIAIQLSSEVSATIKLAVEAEKKAGEE